jgi:LPXTG-site transpeptidase (sortase) family protein
VLVRLIVLVVLAGMPSMSAEAQHFARRASSAACRCEPPGKPRKPRFLLPLAGGIGILPVSIAARDSQLPMLALPSLVDIRDDSPRTALEGERALEIGALAPDTATSLPTIMVIAGVLVSLGAYLLIPRRRKRATTESWRSRFAPGARGRWRLRTVHRRRLGGGLAVAGGLLLLLGSREYAEGAQAQRRARAEWIQLGATIVRVNDEQPAKSRRAVSSATALFPQESGVGTPSAVPLPVFAVSGREIRRGTPIARLLIPSIELDEIVTEGVGPVELNGGPGHFPGSVLPGDAGNSILSAHRDRHFSRVGELTVGSRIRTETHQQTAEWVVTERRIVSKDTPALFEESDATLTLTTCWPLRYFGPAPDRLLIVAKRIS